MAVSPYRSTRATSAGATTHPGMMITPDFVFLGWLDICETYCLITDHHYIDYSLQTYRRKFRSQTSDNMDR